jgi:hypothetical protein
MICKGYCLPRSPSLTLSRKILERLLERLRGVFHQFLSLRESAAASGTRPPNTSPSNAAPNRRFIIIRGDQGPSRHGPLLGFDTPMAPHNAAYKRSLMLEQLCSPDVDLGQRPQSSMSATSTVSDSDREILLEDSPKRWTRGGLLRTIIGAGAARSKSASPGRRGAAVERPPTSAPEIKKRLGLDGAATPPSVSPPDGDGTAMPEGGDAPDRPAPPRPDFRSFCFRFSLELVDRRGPPPAALALQMPRLPQPAHLLLVRHLDGAAGAAREGSAPPPLLRAESSEDEDAGGRAARGAGAPPRGPSPDSGEAPPLLPAAAAMPPDRGAYCGRALAEWTVLVSECHMFFERRKAEGVPGNRWVETPLLGADGFLRVRG